jgi:hypothetical protein
MSKYSYKGDTKGKTVSRAKFYGYLSRTKLVNGIHVVIASRECGDIKYLLSIGVPAKNIVACDLDAWARMNARQLGVVVSHFPSIQETVKYLHNKRKLASVNVDLCCALPKAVTIMKEVMQEVGQKVLVGLVYTRRDHMHSETERMQYMHSAFGGNMPHVYMNYQSTSPMVCAIWRPKHYKLTTYSQVVYDRHGNCKFEAYGMARQVNPAYVVPPFVRKKAVIPRYCKICSDEIPPTGRQGHPRVCCIKCR